MYQITPKITKQFLFDRIPQEQIMEYYLGLPVKLGAKYISPLRHDNYPTCNYWWAPSGELLFKDHSGAFTGNCVQVVRELYGLNFPLALEKIAADFGLMPSTIKSPQKIKELKELPKRDKSKTEITVDFKQWEPDDLANWAQFGITPPTLDLFEVGVANTAWLSDTIIYTLNPYDPCYVYSFGYEEYKLYFPKRSKNETRFLGNSQKIQGFAQLPASGKLLVITKSLKDVMALYELGISAIALQGETIMPTKELIQELRERFEIIYTLYDFDLTGIRTANKIKRQFQIPPIFLTNGRFNSTNQRAKDASEFIKVQTFEKVLQFVNEQKTKHNLW